MSVSAELSQLCQTLRAQSTFSYCRLGKPSAFFLLISQCSSPAPCLAPGLGDHALRTILEQLSAEHGFCCVPSERRLTLTLTFGSQGSLPRRRKEC